tara:strand:+ start:3180 stop:3461 length:282 start_codon:yes stop_codon:yes gene_type:complete
LSSVCKEFILLGVAVPPIFDEYNESLAIRLLAVAVSSDDVDILTWELINGKGPQPTSSLVGGTTIGPHGGFGHGLTTVGSGGPILFMNTAGKH